MKKTFKSGCAKALSAVLCTSLLMGGAFEAFASKSAAASTSSSAITVEYLDRGLVAFNTGSAMMVSWRFLASDSSSTTFKLYRDGSLIYTSNSKDATCYLDSKGSASSKYTLECIDGGKVLSTATTVLVSNQAYKEISLSKPGSSYMPNDMSVGDVDGDGTYELFLKWDPSDSKDNSQSGTTSNVYIDCYKLDGSRLWRVDLGKNIRAGAHYTQFMVADYDGDGKAEMICKTADGTKDGKGTVIGSSSADYRNSSGYILSGPEYLTLFEGSTGKALDTVDYPVPRGTVSSWGDSYGNRVDRFLGVVAYLDTDHPSYVTFRGYYTRMTAVAYDVKNKKLVKRWTFDSNNSANSAAAGNGNHNVMPADVDGDGKQEIVVGSTCIDDNGSLLWCTKLGHGDALHVGDLDPNRSGLEVFMCHEVSPYGISLLDAKTGKTIFHKDNSKDTGRCVGDNIIKGNSGGEFWGVGNDVFSSSGTSISTTKPSMNFTVYWDSDLERELLDGTVVTKHNGSSISTLLSASGVVSNNGTKANPCLSADIFGDWREEIIWSTTDGSAIRIYETPYDTTYRICTLMQDPQYRNQVAGQNVAYNQPPHTSFYLGSDRSLPTITGISVRGAATSSSSSTSATTTQATTTQTTSTGSKYMFNPSKGLSNSYFTAAGSIQTDKGSAVVNGTTLNSCLKLDSKGSLSFTTKTNNAKLTIYVSAKTSNSAVKVNGSALFTGIGTSVQVMTVTLGNAGTYTITKGTNETYLFYVILEENDGTTVATTATTTTAATTAATTKATTAATTAVAATTTKASTSNSTSGDGLFDNDGNSISVKNISDTTVHDPSIIKDTKTGTYYIFGSHMAWAKSTDLQTWTTFTNNINNNYNSLFSTEFAWAKQGDSVYNPSGNIWAPDVIYNEKMGKWCMYVSINGCSWNSSIALLTADSLDGNWTHAGTVIYSGFTSNSSGTHSYTSTDYKKVTGDSSLPSRYTMSSYVCQDNGTNCDATTWNTDYGAHAIDPSVKFDDNGNLWMVYGSWSGGIYMIKLDSSTGLRDYSYKYTLDTNVSDGLGADPYMGYHVGGGKFVSGEAPYLLKAGNYWYMFVSYGGLTRTGGYNIRVYRSSNITGPYVDQNGNSAIATSWFNNINSDIGYKLFGNYKWNIMSKAEVAQGHNSAFVDEDGKMYVVYHTRYATTGEIHNVRVHQMFINEAGWPVAAISEYHGENRQRNPYSASDVTGEYGIILHGTSVTFDASDASNTYKKEETIYLNSNGTVTGAYTGSWKLSSSTSAIDITINGVVYKGVLVKGQINYNSDRVLTFTASAKNGALWGYKKSNTQNSSSSNTTTTTTKATTSTTASTTSSSSSMIFNASSSSNSSFTVAGSITSKGDATYNGITLTKVLKLDSKGSLTFKTTKSGAKVTIVAKAKASGASFKVNSEVVSVGTSPETKTITLGSAGTYTISKNSGETYIYYVVVTQ